MAADAICIFEMLYGSVLRLRPIGDELYLADSAGQICIFGQDIRINIKISAEYPCRLQLIGPTGPIFACMVERGDDWQSIWRQLLGSLGRFVERGIDCEIALNRLATRYRLLKNNSPPTHAQLLKKIETLTADIDDLGERLHGVERENQILRQLLADQILKE